MKAGDKVRVSICSLDWHNTDAQEVFVFICECGGRALICPVSAVRQVFTSGIYPVRHCKECGQELPEGKGG